jgi:Ni,Fe-hydrogenase III small subunit
MFRIIRKSLKTGVVTGEHPAAETPAVPVSQEARDKTAPFKRSLAIREVDTGSCNACDMEMNALMNPVYDAERFGIHIAASPRHADALVVTGPVTVNMERALKDVYKQTPDPKIVIALGDCAIHDLERIDSFWRQLDKARLGVRVIRLHDLFVGFKLSFKERVPQKIVNRLACFVQIVSYFMGLTPQIGLPNSFAVPGFQTLHDPRSSRARMS